MLPLASAIVTVDITVHAEARGSSGRVFFLCLSLSTISSGLDYCKSCLSNKKLHVLFCLLHALKYMAIIISLEMNV